MCRRGFHSYFSVSLWLVGTSPGSVLPRPVGGEIPQLLQGSWSPHCLGHQIHTLPGSGREEVGEEGEEGEEGEVGEDGEEGEEGEGGEGGEGEEGDGRERGKGGDGKGEGGYSVHATHMTDSTVTHAVEQ